MNSLGIIVIGIACIVMQRSWYTVKMHRLGAALIGEAYRVRDDWPEEYPSYRHEAATVLETHGCDDLIAHLPLSVTP